MSEWRDFRNQTASMPEHRAPAEQFRVIACDTFEGPFADDLVGDFPDLQAAIRAAKDALAPMSAVYVYDDHGILQFNDYQSGEILRRSILSGEMGFAVGGPITHVGICIEQGGDRR